MNTLQYHFKERKGKRAYCSVVHVGNKNCKSTEGHGLAVQVPHEPEGTVLSYTMEFMHVYCTETFPSFPNWNFTKKIFADPSGRAV
jgi:hypothetical protein